MTGNQDSSGKGAQTENNDNLKWPQDCGHYDGSEYEHGHLKHKCNHPYNKQSCMPASCPLKKLEILQAKLETYEEELKDHIDTEEELWYRDEIKWLNDEIDKIVDEVVE